MHKLLCIFSIYLVLVTEILSDKNEVRLLLKENAKRSKVNITNEEKTLTAENDINTIRIEKRIPCDTIKLDNISALRDFNASNGCVGEKVYCDLTKEYEKMLEDYIFPKTYEWVLISFHAAVFVVGLIGNVLVCIAVYRNRSVKTVTNYFIVNLVAADFMVILFCLPSTVLWDVTETWFLGDTLCKILLYFQSVSATVSILTLTFISLDRRGAFFFPLKFKSTTSRAMTALIIIWVVALTFSTPELIVLNSVKVVELPFDLEYLTQCTATSAPKSDLVWQMIRVLLIYTIPLLLVTVVYYQIVRMLWRSGKILGQAETV